MTDALIVGLGLAAVCIVGIAAMDIGDRVIARIARRRVAQAALTPDALDAHFDAYAGWLTPEDLIPGGRLSRQERRAFAEIAEHAGPPMSWPDT